MSLVSPTDTLVLQAKVQEISAKSIDPSKSPWREREALPRLTDVPEMIQRGRLNLKVFSEYLEDPKTKPVPLELMESFFMDEEKDVPRLTPKELYALCLPVGDRTTEQSRCADDAMKRVTDLVSTLQEQELLMSSRTARVNKARKVITQLEGSHRPKLIHIRDEAQFADLRQSIWERSPGVNWWDFLQRDGRGFPTFTWPDADMAKMWKNSFDEFRKAKNAGMFLVPAVEGGK